MTQKTILITGASSGFGEATAIKLAKNHHRLILLARSLDKLQIIKAQLSQQTEIQIIQADVSKLEQIQNGLNQLPEAFQQIDVLVNNAGLALGVEKAFDAEISDWETVINTNIKGFTYCIHQVLPQMVKRNSGLIINLGSIAGTWPYPGGNVYGATKAYVKQFSQNLRADLFGTQVRVTNLEPGLAKSNFSNVRFDGDTKKADSLYQDTHPLTSEDIANMIEWIIETPAHININRLEVMPTSQTFGALPVAKNINKI